MAMDDWEVEVDRKSNGEVRFSVSVPDENVEPERKQAINELKQEVEISGFRKGKVPDSIIKKKRPQQVQEALLQRLVPMVCRRVYDEYEIEPIQKPQIEDFSFDEEFKLEVSVLERPTVDVSDQEYKGIELTVEDDSVSDEQLEDRLEELRESEASLEPLPLSRPVEEGDFVDIKFQGYDSQGNPVEGTGGDNQVIEVGSDRFITEIEEGLIGASEGENRQIKANFPDDFIDEDLAGSSLQFDVNVNEIKEQRKPDLDSDEFLEAMEVDSVDELRENVRDQMSEEDEEKRRQKLSEQIYDFFVDHYDFEIPETLIEDEIDTIINDYRQQVEAQGREFEEYLKQQEQELDEFREDVRPEAIRRIKLTLIFQAIAEEEEVEVQEEEFDEYLDELSEQTGMDPSELEELPDEQQQSMRYQLRDDKVLDLIIDEAEIEEVDNIEDEESSEEDEPAPAGSQS